MKMIILVLVSLLSFSAHSSYDYSKCFGNLEKVYGDKYKGHVRKIVRFTVTDKRLMFEDKDFINGVAQSGYSASDIGFSSFSNPHFTARSFETFFANQDKLILCFNSEGGKYETILLNL